MGWGELSEVLLTQIFSHLSLSDLSSVALVCSHWSSSSHSNTVWGPLCQRFWLLDWNGANEVLDEVGVGAKERQEKGVYRMAFGEMMKKWGKYLSVYAQVSSLWKRIESWLSTHRHGFFLLKSLRPGLSEDEIDRIEATAKGPFPLRVRLFYRIHNGQYCDWMSLPPAIAQEISAWLLTDHSPKSSSPSSPLLSVRIPSPSSSSSSSSSTSQRDEMDQDQEQEARDATPMEDEGSGESSVESDDHGGECRHTVTQGLPVPGLLGSYKFYHFGANRLLLSLQEAVALSRRIPLPNCLLVLSHVPSSSLLLYLRLPSFQAREEVELEQKKVSVVSISQEGLDVEIADSFVDWVDDFWNGVESGCFELESSCHLSLFPTYLPSPLQSASLSSSSSSTISSLSSSSSSSRSSAGLSDSGISEMGQTEEESQRERSRTRSTQEAGYCVTNGIHVMASPLWVPEHLQDETHLFAYRIRIWVRPSDDPSAPIYKLRTRHWRFCNNDQDPINIDGEGVIGFYPIMKPGSYFEYESCTTASPQGSMEGHFAFESATKPRLLVRVPKFSFRPLDPIPSSPVISRASALVSPLTSL